MIEIAGLNKSYGQKKALSDFSLKLEEGSVYGLVGPNGAGKTTAIRIIAGLLQADSGVILADGKDFSPLRSEMIGYMPDFFGIYEKLKVHEYMMFFADIYGIRHEEANRRMGELLELVGLTDEEDTYVDTMSRGMKQKLCLARCLIHDPKLLILDEPASGLDPRSRYEFKQIIRKLNKEGRTIMISSHILPDLAEICSDICIIDQGRIVLNGPIADIEYEMISTERIEIKVAGSAENAAALLKNDPMIDNLTWSGGTLSVAFSGTAQESSRILKVLVDHRIPVYSFSRAAGNLEALFMQITQSEEAPHVH